MYYQTSNNSQFMQDEDLLYTILADLKRTVREYTTATTESSCPTVRQMFTQLTNDTLRMQGDLYNLMKQLNMYSTSSKALRQDVDKSIQDARNLQQKNRQFVQQKTSAMGQYAQASNPYQQQQSSQNPYYM
ncbi:spore coat protein CotF [Paenibacillus rhizosphaerae]|uniref:Spore coat protein CotF n=1 Tax=Paenibacillus rhizosphaerae TaxID=297318 RepID=A0A839TV86_9BACL|nr:spore coat protein [Paenibacillus rhizosphaerae]MBB3129328.1 spore coat protein CotF [Paenibacillus rhizosphaerae]